MRGFPGYCCVAELGGHAITLTTVCIHTHFIILMLEQKDISFWHRFPAKHSIVLLAVMLTAQHELVTNVTDQEQQTCSTWAN